MPNASGYLKRGQPALYPHEIKVVEDKTHELYDPRIESPVTDEFIRNLVIVGQIVPVAVRIEDDDALIVDGRSRWKGGTVINHLCGFRAYDGKLKAVLDAIERNHGTDLEKLIVERCAPLGIKLAFTVRRGTMSDAVSGMVSANEQRTADDKEAKIRRAQRLAGHNHTPEEIATVMGQPVATVKRWIKVDLDAPKAKKTRAPTTRPSAKVVKAVSESLRGTVEFQLIGEVVAWTTGAIPDDYMLEKFPFLAEALGAKSKAKAA